LIDIGANVGSTSVLLGDTFQRAILFEPNPVAAARSRENLCLNKLSFEIEEIALSDVSGTVEFEDIGGTSSTNRVVVGFRSSANTRIVPRITFDQHLLDRNLTLPSGTIVKIDVEGHENAVLRGMQNFLRVGRPRLVMFEYLQRTNLSETRQIFDQVGYVVFRLCEHGPVLAELQVKPLQNLFACPIELQTEFGLMES